MVACLRANRTAFRRAVFASVAIHIVVGALLVLALRIHPNSEPPAPGIDTRADVVVRLFDDGPSVEARVMEAPSPAVVAERPAAPEPEIGRLPHADSGPRTLPSEILAIISRSVARGRSRAFRRHSPFQRFTAHDDGKTVVYVLDCSGSMGEFDKPRARGTPCDPAARRGVRFQVVAYNSLARAIVSGTGALPATAANIELAESTILAQAAAGRSNHLEGIRVAARFRPDFIVLLTDADGLARDQFKAVLAALEKPTYICLAKVSASSVGAAQELR